MAEQGSISDLTSGSGYLAVSKIHSHGQKLCSYVPIKPTFTCSTCKYKRTYISLIGHSIKYLRVTLVPPSQSAACLHKENPYRSEPVRASRGETRKSHGADRQTHLKGSRRRAIHTHTRTNAHAHAHAQKLASVKNNEITKQQI